MKAWHTLLREVWNNGEERADRTGVGTRSIFGLRAEFENTESSFPAVTTKKLYFKQMAAELACFIRGCDNLEQFHELGCTIWDGNGEADYWAPHQRRQGDLGRIYGVQWRDWRSEVNGMVQSTDQLQKLVQGLKEDPYGRRHIVTAWNPGELRVMCLPPCHTFFQCYVSKGDTLNMNVYMRSVDLVLGLPFDVASYALLQRLIAHEVNLKTDRLIFMLGDAHIYLNHEAALQTILSRQPHDPPALELWSDSLWDFMPEDASLDNYSPFPAVEAKLNV